MNKLMNWMESTLVPFANKFSQNAILKTISGGMMKLLPIIMAGSIFSIFQSIPWDPYTNFMESTGLATLIGYIPAVTTGMLSVYVAYSVGSEGIKNFGHPNESFISGMLSLMGYLMLVPVVDDTIGTSYLGTQGIFVALICGVLEAAILNWVLNKNITIKMPAGVPPMIGDSFAALIPAFIIGAVFALIKWGFSFTPYGNPVDCIYTIIQTPLQSLTSSLPAFLLLLLIAQVLWFFGVHGSYSVLPILFPMWFAFAAENAELAAAGQPITNCLNAAMWDLACLGGAGSTIGLVILLFFKSKSARYKEFGKLTLPCGIFGVNEPVIFGLPIMLNPLMFIPFVITPVIIVSLAYFLIQVGIVAAPIGIVGAGSIPPFIHGLVNGSWTFAVYELVAVVISVVIYYPFFKVLDAQALKEEAQAEKE
jgi:PTS system cellobiose-specific IIC component